MLEGRCQFTIGSIEPIYGRIATGEVKLFPQLVGESLPDIPRTKFYFLVSKQSPRGKEIVDALNRGIKKLQESGQYEEIFKTYLPTVGSGL